MIPLRCIVLVGMTLSIAAGHAQTLSVEKARQTLDDFRKQSRNEFDSFRQQAMADFIEFARNPWKEFEETPPIPKPKEEPVPPVVMPKEEEEKPIKDKLIPIKEVIPPLPKEPQPTPVEPIKAVPLPEVKHLQFSFFGTQATVRFDVDRVPQIKGLGSNDIADALQGMQSEYYDNLIVDCLSLRDRLKLSDWAYLQMLKHLADRVSESRTNESVLLMAYLYLQSGYKMRLATDGSKLYMLYASKHQIYNQAMYMLDGELYYGTEELPMKLQICEAAFPKEQSLSLFIHSSQSFDRNCTASRDIVSKRYPEVKISVGVNKNLLDFYNTYPASMIHDNFMMKWSMYAQTPLDEEVRSQIYPQLMEEIKKLGKLEAVERLLNLLQTGLTYGYDSEVWGCDRTFFAEETLYYPFCDCEDRAILLSRLVRDLLGLETILVYYPGHLAMAVAFEEEVNGDYILYKGKHFVVCDPTFIGAPVGKTMTGMDNSTATVILID